MQFVDLVFSRPNRPFTPVSTALPSPLELLPSSSIFLDTCTRLGNIALSITLRQREPSFGSFRFFSIPYRSHGGKESRPNKSIASGPSRILDADAQFVLC